MIGLFIIAHAPLASAMRQCVAHVYTEEAQGIVALDVQAFTPPEESLAQARILMDQLGSDPVLVLTDMVGATPCNVAQKLVDGVHSKLVAGLNLPMLLRAVSYRHEQLDSLVTRALAGASQGVMQLSNTVPQNQQSSHHDQGHHNHQQ